VTFAITGQRKPAAVERAAPTLLAFAPASG